MPVSRAVAVAALVLGLTGCAWARPVTYSIDPGISASFTPSQLTASDSYAKMFCTVLETEFATAWGPCAGYVKMASSHPPGTLDDDAIFHGYTLLRLGGLGAQCLASKAEAFEDAGDHLAQAHGLPSLHVPLGAFDTSEMNAVRIRDFIAGRPAAEKFIAIAHSKGAADMMVALTTFPAQLTQVRALITVAGAVGGSWLVDRLQALNQNLFSLLSLPTCIQQVQALTANAVDSMRRTNRQAYLAQHEHLTVPSFSISAVSTEANTSKILKPLWKRIAPYAQEQDSHLVERETIVPGGTFLGRALGDHWAVAFPFDPNPNMPAPAMAVIDKNTFPREALIEAAVRVVLPTLP